MQEHEDEGTEISSSFLGFLILGGALIFIGVLVLLVASIFFDSSGSSGVVIFIGPFPLVFGKGPNSFWLILIGIIIAVLSIALFLIMNRRLGLRH
jgi:uncharacterized membrane protein